MQGNSIYPKNTPEVKLGLTTSYALSEAEMNALEAIMECADFKGAAKRLGCTERTVHFHINNILQKTGYKNRFELCTAVAQKTLIITTPDKDLE